MSIEKYSKFISLHEQKTKTIGLRSIAEEDKHDSKQYPKANHLHLDMYEGDERHIIKGIPHSDDNAEHVHNKMVDHVSKKTKIKRDTVDEIFSENPHHIAAASDPEDSHKMKPVVHNSVDDFIKHNSKAHVKMAKYSNQEDD